MLRAEVFGGKPTWYPRALMMVPPESSPLKKTVWFLPMSSEEPGFTYLSSCRQPGLLYIFSLNDRCMLWCFIPANIILQDGVQLSFCFFLLKIYSLAPSGHIPLIMPLVLNNTEKIWCYSFLVFKHYDVLWPVSTILAWYVPFAPILNSSAINLPWAQNSDLKKLTKNKHSTPSSIVGSFSKN